MDNAAAEGFEDAFAGMSYDDIMRGEDAQTVPATQALQVADDEYQAQPGPTPTISSQIQEPQVVYAAAVSSGGKPFFQAGQGTGAPPPAKGTMLEFLTRNPKQPMSPAQLQAFAEIKRRARRGGFVLNPFDPQTWKGYSGPRLKGLGPGSLGRMGGATGMILQQGAESWANILTEQINPSNGPNYFNLPFAPSGGNSTLHVLKAGMLWNLTQYGTAPIGPGVDPFSGQRATGAFTPPGTFFPFSGKMPPGQISLRSPVDPD